VVSVVEDVGGRLVDRDRPRRGRRVYLLPAVQRQGVEPVVALLLFLIRGVHLSSSWLIEERPDGRPELVPVL
jgi:hypothetical protein